MAVNPAAVALTESKFSSFTIHNTLYYNAGEPAQPITADIFIPKGVKPGPHPVVVRFHGGFLITGSSMNAAFFPAWILDYALVHSAILVSPNYVKLPESNGLDLLSNLAGFWKWLRTDLQGVVASVAGEEVSVDQSKTLIIGHSAGGYLAAQSALTQPAGSIKAVVMGYPMLDMAAPFGEHPFGRETLHSSIVDDHLATMQPGKVITGVPPPPMERLDLAVAIVQHKRFPEILGKDKSLYPLGVLKEQRSFPPVFVFHGTEDRAVDVAGTRKFAEVVKDVLEGDKIMIKLMAGDHGFDSLELTTLEAPWLKEGLSLMTKEWLQ